MGKSPRLLSTIDHLFCVDKAAYQGTSYLSSKFSYKSCACREQNVYQWVDRLLPSLHLGLLNLAWVCIMTTPLPLCDYNIYW